MIQASHHKGAHLPAPFQNSLRPGTTKAAGAAESGGDGQGVGNVRDWPRSNPRGPFMNLSRLAIPVLCLPLTACFGLGSTPPAPEPELSPAARFIAENNAGDRTNLVDAAFGGEVAVSIEGAFTSAAARECKRGGVNGPSREAEIVVLCKKGDARELMPRVWSHNAE